MTSEQQQAAVPCWLLAAGGRAVLGLASAAWARTGVTSDHLQGLAAGARGEGAGDRGRCAGARVELCAVSCCCWCGCLLLP